jgi:hypothetical protein
MQREDLIDGNTLNRADALAHDVRVLDTDLMGMEPGDVGSGRNQKEWTRVMPALPRLPVRLLS